MIKRKSSSNTMLGIGLAAATLVVFVVVIAMGGALRAGLAPWPGIAVAVLAVGAFTVSREHRSLIVAGLLAASGIVGIVYGLIRTEFLTATSFPGPIFGIILGLPILALAVAAAGGPTSKRAFALVLAGLAAVALFGGLVHGVLVAAHVSEPAATTVRGLTTQRLWATTVAVLALVGVVIGGLALASPNSRLRTASGRPAAIVALAAGLIAVVNGVLVLAIANGGPGTGNGVVGGAAALVLGVIAAVLGAVTLARSRPTASGRVA